MATSPRIHVYCQHCEASYAIGEPAGPNARLVCPKCKSPTVVLVDRAQAPGQSRLAIASIGAFLAALLAIAVVLYYATRAVPPSRGDRNVPATRHAASSSTAPAPSGEKAPAWEQQLSEAEQEGDCRAIEQMADQAWKQDLPGQAAQAYRLALRLLAEQAAELSKRQATIQRKLVGVQSEDTAPPPK